MGSLHQVSTSILNRYRSLGMFEPKTLNHVLPVGTVEIQDVGQGLNLLVDAMRLEATRTSNTCSHKDENGHNEIDAMRLRTSNL